MTDKTRRSPHGRAQARQWIGRTLRALRSPRGAGMAAAWAAFVLALGLLAVWQGPPLLRDLAAKIRAGIGEAVAQTHSTTIALDAAIRFQTIDSWAVYPRYWEHDKVNNRFDNSYAPHAEAISKFLADEVGINGVRVEIWSGLENPVDHWSQFFQGRNSYEKDKSYRYEKINDNDDPFSVDPAGFQFTKFDHRMRTMVLPLKRAVEANGERLYINVNYVDFEPPHSIQGSLSHAKNPEEFAEFVLVYFEHLRDVYGIVPDSFEMVLEPDNSRDWRGREIGRGLLAVKRRLAANGFTPEFVAPSTAALAKAADYFDEMAEVPGAVQALDTLSYHRYGRHKPEDLLAVKRRAEDYGLKTAMLEKIGAGIDELLTDLTVTQVSSWQQWALAGRPDWVGGIFYLLVDISDPDNLKIEMDAPTYHLAQLFKFVRGGAQRIAATSDNADKRTVAFVNRDGSWAVIVRAKEGGGPLTVTGLPAGRYGLRFTDADQEITQLPEIAVAKGQPLAVRIPSRGVLSIYTSPGAGG